MTLYEACTLTPPFRGDSLERLYERILNEDLPPLDSLKSGVPKDLACVLARAVEKDPSHRFATAKEFGEDLRRILEYRPILSRRPGPVGRLLRWRRRNPALCNALIACLVVLALASGWGGAVHLFRSVPQNRLSEIWPDAPWIDEASEIRRVPIPLTERPPSMLPGRTAFRVLTDRGSLKRGDLLPTAHGSEPPSIGEEVRLWRWGHWTTVPFPRDARVVPTTNPLLMDDATSIGVTPLEGVMIGAGEYLAVLRLAGFEDCRISFHVDFLEDPYHQHGHADTSVRLFPSGQIPEDFVRVTIEVDLPDRTQTMAFMRHEVTVDEYLEFLNAREILEEMITAGDGRYVPRQPSGAPLVDGDRRNGFRPSRAAQGPFPVVGISHADAVRYVAWKNASAPPGWRYGLPTFDEWARALYGGETRKYAFGDFFHPGWTKSRYSRDTWGLEDVMTYWRDETIFGAFDMTGSVAEWGAGDDGADRVPVFGGSLGDSKAADFLNSRTRDIDPRTVAEWIGLRLVLREVVGDER